MALPPSTLRVLPNPYCHLDHEGRPAGACPADALDHVRYVATKVTRESPRGRTKASYVDKQARQHVAARRVAVVVGTQAQDTTLGGGGDAHDLFFDFDHPIDPVTITAEMGDEQRVKLVDDAKAAAHAKGPMAAVVPLTPYYVRAVKSGELLAADAKTAKLCGFRVKDFRDPAELLAEEKAGAIARWKAHHDEEPEATVAHWAAWHAAKAAERKAKADLEAPPKPTPASTTSAPASAPTTDSAPSTIPGSAPKGGK